MTDVISLEAERDRRTGPDAEFRTVDQFGRPMFAFCADYQHAGATFAVQVWAYDFSDAEQRISAMRNSLVLVGQIYSETGG